MSLRLLALCACVSHGLAAGQDDPVRTEWSRLQGTWQVVRSEEGEKAVAEDYWRTIQFVIKGQELRFVGDKILSDKASRIALTIDPTTAPKVIDLKIEAGVFKGTTLEGVYELKDNELRICLRTDGLKNRPLELKATAGQPLVLFVLKRAEKGKE